MEFVTLENEDFNTPSFIFEEDLSTPTVSVIKTGCTRFGGMYYYVRLKTVKIVTRSKEYIFAEALKSTVYDLDRPFDE